MDDTTARDDETVRDGPGVAAASASEELSRGDTIGRYVVLEELGRGGMGRVVRAYDPKLHREVALKLLRSDAAGEEGTERLMREARAMAQLSHPNVVPVYDAERLGERVFITMELVRGETLRDWAERGRPVSEIVDALVQAGRGLAAAHAARLIHRDFKPTNVMIGEDGRARVMDFGLARANKSELAPPSERSERSNALVGTLTQAGFVMGTPRYMAPEQHWGTVADERADQFAFCASAFEVLYGRVPFEGDTPRDLMRVKLEQPPDTKGRPEVPSRVRDAIMRGLSPSPEDRWPSLEALLDELQPRPRRRVSVWLWPVLGVVAVVGLVLGLRAPDGDPCAGADDEIARVWGAEQQAAVRDAISGTGAVSAKDIARRVVDGIDAYAERWQAEYVDACEDTTVRKVQSEALLDRRMGCLHRRLATLAGTVDGLTTHDVGAIEHAIEGLDALPSPERCADPDFLLVALAPPEDPAAAEKAAELGARLERIAARGRLLHPERALLELEGARPELEDLGYAPLNVELDVHRAVLTAYSARHEAAAHLYASAYYAARALGHDRMAIRASRGAAYEFGSELGQFERGMQWSRLAEAEIEHAGDDAEMVGLLDDRAAIRETHGDFEGALADHERAHDLAVASEGVDASRSLLGMASDHETLGHYPQARALYDEALDYRREHLGEDHPQLAVVHGNRGNLELAEGHYDAAERELARAREIAIAAYGPRSESAIIWTVSLGNAHAMQGDVDRAREDLESAMTLTEEVLGGQHPLMATILSNLGRLDHLEGELTSAQDRYARALELLESTRGPEEPRVVDLHFNLGLIASETGKDEQAREHLERAVELRERIFGPESPEQVSALGVLASVYSDLGRVDEGIETAQQSLSLAESLDVELDPLVLATARLSVAYALAARDGLTPRVRELANAAREVFVERGEIAQSLVDEVDELLARRR